MAASYASPDLVYFSWLNHSGLDVILTFVSFALNRRNVEVVLSPKFRRCEIRVWKILNSIG
jgi:hypothetical protein